MIPCRSTLVPDHEAGDVGQVDQRDVEGVAEPDEARRLVGGVDHEHAALDLRLIGDDAGHAPADAGQPHDDLPREQLLDLEPRAGIHHPVDHLVHVEPLALVVGHDLVDRAPGLGLDRGRPRRRLAERAGHVGQVALGQLDRFLVGGGQHVTAAGDLAVHARAAQLFQRRLLADGHLDHARAADVERGLALHHDDQIGQRRQIGRAGRRGTEQDADLRHHARELDLVVEDPAGVEAAGEDLDLLGDPAAGGVHQVEHRHAQPRGLLLDAHDLQHGLLAPRAGLHRVVVGHDADGAAPHAADAGDDAVGRRVGLVRAREEEVLLELAARIEQQLQSVADEELAFGPELVTILGVALLDARAFLVVAIFTLAHGEPYYSGAASGGSE